MKVMLLLTFSLLIFLKCSCQTFPDSIIYARDYAATRIMIKYISLSLKNGSILQGRYNNIRNELNANSIQNPISNKKLIALLESIHFNKLVQVFLPKVNTLDSNNIRTKTGVSLAIVNGLFSIDCLETKNPICKNMRDTLIEELSVYFNNNYFVIDSMLKNKNKILFNDSIVFDSLNRKLNSRNGIISSQDFSLKNEKKNNREIVEKLNNKGDELNSAKSIILYIIVCSILIFISAFIFYIKKQKDHNHIKNVNLELVRKLENVNLELKKVELNDLCKYILPEKIAQRLRNGEKLIAENYSNVSIIFIDIEGFTNIISIIGANEMVKVLNDIFLKFDELTEKHGLAKIKTIGDCYMAVAGITEHNPNPDHINAIAAMALDVLGKMKGYETPSGYKINLRIGLNCGSVVGGVIGKKNFIFDVWGDAVNIASRMESTGEIGEIHCSEDIQKALIGRYEFRKRTPLTQVKGKKPMQTYFLYSK